MIRNLLRPEVLIFMIPIVAIICSTIKKLSRMRFEHEERLARIEAGIDPDLDEEYS